MNDNNKRPKPTIEPIVIPKEKLEKLQELLNSGRSSCAKDAAIRDMNCGKCCSCAKLPTKIVKYKLEDITLVERYCDECFKKI